ncbi:MAG: MmcQ/YjbR family DNA-binding protein [Treponema sp.]|nr:MmcQ/YjbR family DNA-binding protein [Treponema sp.]
MDYSYIFSSAKPIKEKFAAFGFKKRCGSCVCKKALCGGDFYALLELGGQTLTAQVYDAATDELYAPFDMRGARGSFVAAVREEVQKIVDDFYERCFESEDIHKKYFDFIERQFNCKADFPWAQEEGAAKRYSDAAVFRCPNQKWFALVMEITYKNLGLANDKKVFAVNLKADPERVADLADKKTIFPAYHMNKKHWITVLLTSATDFDLLRSLTEQSRALVMGKDRAS